jgi:hypothetical protein
MNLNLSWASVYSFLRQAAAIVGLVVSIGNTDHLPASVRTVLVAVSGAILTAEHYAQAQANPPGTTSTTTTTTVQSTGGERGLDPTRSLP